jgi:hypothetical protein
MILSSRSPGLVNEALSIKEAHPLCNIAVLAAGIWNPCVDGTAASEGLHRTRLHHLPMIYVILVAWTVTILVGSSPDFGAPTLSISWTHQQRAPPYLPDPPAACLQPGPCPAA